MYNNEVTYDEKWETPENEEYLKKLNKYFDASHCSPSCPHGWAKEVYELLSHLDKEFGIARNEDTLRGYFTQGNWYFDLTIGPYISAVKALYMNFIGYKSMDQRNKYQVERYKTMTLSKRITEALNTIPGRYRYGVRLFKAQVVNRLYNKIFKPKITLGQLKEKYGELTIYHSEPKYLSEYIEELIAKTEVKLAVKGCYYPVESLWNNAISHNVDSEHYPEDYEIKHGEYDGKPWKSIRKTTHRTAMKELGLDLNDIRQKAEARKAKLDEEKAQQTQSNSKTQP